jgi:hypothetical protein
VKCDETAVIDVKDWLGSLAQVAGVAGQLIASFLADDEGKTQSRAATGEVEWSYVQQAGKQPLILARNDADAPVGLTYTLARENQNLSVHQPLDPGNSYDATADVDQFLDGNVAVAPTGPAAAGDDDLGRTIVFAISFLAIGAAVAVVKGVTLSYNRTPTGFAVSITSDAVPITARVTARDSSGNAVSAELKTGSTGADGNVYEIELPPGVDLDPVADQLDLVLELPGTFYESATAERSARQFAGAAAGGR